MLRQLAAESVVLAVGGLYGVLSVITAQRTREISVRMAIGALPTRIVGLVVSQGLTLAAIGLGIGLAGAFALTRVMSALLHAVSPTDPPTLAATSAMLLAVAALASYLPARRATSPVVLGEREDEALLGAVTLETLGLMLNPLTRTLQPMRMLLAGLTRNRRPL